MYSLFILFNFFDEIRKLFFMFSALYKKNPLFCQ
ncbi:hypothetical protein PRO82_002165 [Candidatus Protochlamydia amoebophila]|nr:hypothetical protein [Candidatus Protochlamydia amoebophila]